uniref:Uncharacterized protein n=1 Tax=Oryza glumipatula TaxID=40148 RepID=A0A0D9YVS6_9ORYZ
METISLRPKCTKEKVHYYEKIYADGKKWSVLAAEQPAKKENVPSITHCLIARTAAAEVAVVVLEVAGENHHRRIRLDAAATEPRRSLRLDDATAIAPRAPDLREGEGAGRPPSQSPSSRPTTTASLRRGPRRHPVAVAIVAPPDVRLPSSRPCHRTAWEEERMWI